MKKEFAHPPDTVWGDSREEERAVLKERIKGLEEAAENTQKKIGEYKKAGFNVREFELHLEGLNREIEELKNRIDSMREAA